MSTAHILLVEDNEGDIILTKDAFEERCIIDKISVVRDGDAAIDFLEELDPLDSSSHPDIILLDVNLPKRNGHEVLKFIKGSEKYKHIPVIMLTTSSSEKDISEAYKHHVNSFITKPLNLKEFMDAIYRIEDFWMNVVQLPPKKK